MASRPLASVFGLVSFLSAGHFRPARLFFSYFSFALVFSWAKRRAAHRHYPSQNSQLPHRQPCVFVHVSFLVLLAFPRRFPHFLERILLQAWSLRTLTRRFLRLYPSFVSFDRYHWKLLPSRQSLNLD